MASCNSDKTQGRRNRQMTHSPCLSLSPSTYFSSLFLRLCSQRSPSSYSSSTQSSAVAQFLCTALTHSRVREMRDDFPCTLILSDLIKSSLTSIGMSSQDSLKMRIHSLVFQAFFSVVSLPQCHLLKDLTCTCYC